MAPMTDDPFPRNLRWAILFGTFRAAAGFVRFHLQYEIIGARCHQASSRFGWFALCLVLFTGTARAGLLEAPPEVLGLDPAVVDRIDEVVNRDVAAKKVPGAVVLVGRNGKIALRRAFGQSAVEPKSEPMSKDTIFDLASLTKPVATATSIMVLLDRGKIKLDDRLGALLPKFDNHGKGDITVEQLLRHRSGLIADNPLSDYADGPEKAWQRLAELDLVGKPGERFLYSDVNFEILGRIVEKVSGERLDAFFAANIARPLGTKDLFFPAVPAAVGGGGTGIQLGFSTPGEVVARVIDSRRFAPTERYEGSFLLGRVHDPRARAIGGVAGHAGLFGTADALALFAQMILDGGKAADGTVILKPETVRLMTSPGETPARQKRGLGWDMDTGFSGPRGRSFGPTSFGHTGFTGTSLWIDPESRTFVILLTSRLHPDGKGGSPTALRSEIATIVGEAIVDVPVRQVDCGIDVLIRDGFAPLKGKRVGLVTNHTGQARDGRSTIDILFKAPEVKLVALFSPEHGIRGAVDREVGDGKDEATGLPVFSLYGKTRKPSPESLKGLDVLVYDIQDGGARFYTYISTLGLALEAAGEAKIPVIVLDRPNPIGGEVVSGPVRDDEFESFVAHHAMPIRHGMTVGELAGMFVGERRIPVDLTVIRCDGWRRADLFDRTGLAWINPSPNMRSLTEALLYPGVALLEFTNLATGRGTDTPFEKVGAPWIDGVAWSRALNGLGLGGVRFVPIRFSPTERQHAGKSCGGVQILITDWAVFEPIDLGLGMAVTLRSLHPETWETAGLLKLLADNGTYQAIRQGRGVEELKSGYAEELARFREVRERYLLYRSPALGRHSRRERPDR